MSRQVDEDKAPQTLVEVAIRNLMADGVGLFKATLKAAEAVSIVWAWTVATRDMGEYPTVAEFSRHWKQTERTSFRELALFRRAFPAEESPQRLVEAILAHDRAEEVLARHGAALSLPASLA